MTDYNLSPDKQIEIGDKVYTLDSSFKTLAAIQTALKDDIVRLLLRTTDLRQDELATVIATASGKSISEIGEKLLDLGVMTHEYAYLVSQVMAWLSIALAPKADREKKADEMRAFLGKMKNPASPGTTTSASA